MTVAQDSFHAVVSDYSRIRSDVLKAVSHADALDAALSGLKVTILNALVVSVTGLIEQTVRELFAAYLLGVQAGHSSHQSLRADLQRSSFEAYLSVLKGQRDPTVLASAHVSIKKLELCVSGKGGFELLVNELVYNQGNCRTSQITEIAKRIGLRNILSSICDCAEVQDWCGEDALDRRVLRFTNEWNSLFDERDLIVHQMSNASGWGATKIVQNFQQIDIFVSRLADVLRADLADLIATEAHRSA